MLKTLTILSYVVLMSIAIANGEPPDTCRRPVERNPTPTCSENTTQAFEGECLCCYHNWQGNPTIGIGFDLNRFDVEDVLWKYKLKLSDVLKDCKHKTTKACLSNAQALGIFYDVSYYEAKKCVDSNLGKLPSPKYEAIVDVVFTVGCKEFRGYKEFVEALKEQDWDRAAEELLKTKWSRTVIPERRDSDYGCIKGEGEPTTPSAPTTPSTTKPTTQEPTTTTERTTTTRRTTSTTTTTTTRPPPPPPKTDLAVLRRLYDYKYYDHFYTISPEEERIAISRGAISENQMGYLATSPLDSRCATMRPLIRLYRSGTKDHLMVTSEAEAQKVVAVDGYKYEGILGYCTERAECGSLFALNRYWNSHDHDHFYTIDRNEINNIAAHPEWGWSFEGTSCYVWPSNPAPRAGSLHNLNISQTMPQ